MQIVDSYFICIANLGSFVSDLTNECSVWTRTTATLLQLSGKSKVNAAYGRIVLLLSATFVIKT
jgi:hypothetical protein